jgi:transcription termination factor Rho
VTETDLITAQGSDNNQLSIPVDQKNSTSAAAVSETTPAADGATDARATRTRSGRGSGALTAMVLPELRALAKEIGVEGASGMRKSELIAAIREARAASNGKSRQNGDTKTGDAGTDTKADATDAAVKDAKGGDDVTATTNQPEKAAADAADTKGGATETPAAEQPRRARRAAREPGAPAGQADAKADVKKADAKDDVKADVKDEAKTEGSAQTGTDAPATDTKADEKTGDEKTGAPETKPEADAGDQDGQGRAEDEGEGRQGRRGRRFRDRRRRERGGGDGEAELREDDVLQPVAGILDVLDNYAFVRTSGYLPGPNDVYVSMNMVRKYGLRRGDAITGAVRVPREGEQPNQRQKFNPLVRIDSVNGGPVEAAKNRPEFSKLTPLYPNQRLRLETTPDKLTTRVIDLIMPIGKGQRALIVSPPKAGKTTVLQDIANAITTNNPECHLMVVLVDERPEEVTDMQRSVKGEVISSTFDRPPSDHTTVAELAIERAKRLVEQGKDVVVLLDSITRLGRAYNNASPASGRILSGGVDSTALYPPKRFLGAARNIEEGGSLTIIATAMVETGSTGDTVIFEEFKGTGNAELKLDRKIAERRVFPAVDVGPSGTRKDELLMSPDEFAVVHKLRRLLSGLDSHQAIDLLLNQLRKTKNNFEFLMQVSKTAPGSMDVD